MKKAVSILAAVAVMATAGAAFAAVANTKHNLSTSGSNITGGTDQICIFCHTPHNAVQNYPLWNRTNPAGGGFSLYSSKNMKNHVGTGGFSADSVSLFCMSCHDGGTLGGRVARSNAGTISVTGTGNVNGDTISAGNARLGTDLTNDHPVNFNVVQSGGTTGIYATINGNPNKIGQSSATALPLFRTTKGDYTMECASCHLVHDNTFPPFLRKSNSASGLCLECHNK